MTLWERYKTHITQNLIPTETPQDDLSYWRNKLFTVTVIYLVPFSLIAILPGIYYTFITHQYIIFYADLFTLAGVFFIAWAPKVSIQTRKVLFITTAYLIGCILTYLTGLHGAGLLYLQTACIYSILIFPTKRAYWNAVINTTISIVFIVIIYYELTPIFHTTKESVSEWIAVLSNLVFLSLLSTAFIPQLLYGLQGSLDEEKKLQKEISNKQQSLIESLHQVEKKNRELTDIAYLQSHILRAPLANMLGIVQILKDPQIDTADKEALYNDLLKSLKDMDDRIHEVAEKTHQAKIN